MIIITPIE